MTIKTHGKGPFTSNQLYSYSTLKTANCCPVFNILKH